MNLYGFVGNNAVNDCDAFGLMSWREVEAERQGFGYRIDLSDSNHWNWQAAVLFTYYGKDGRYHVGIAISNAEEWTWDQRTKSWGSPHHGSY